MSQFDFIIDNVNTYLYLFTIFYIFFQIVFQAEIRNIKVKSI